MGPEHKHHVHDDVIKWKHFPRYWPFVRGIHRSPMNSPHKGQWRGALMLSLICVWINGWVNNREAGDLRRYRFNYDVNVMGHAWNVLAHWPQGIRALGQRWFNEWSNIDPLLVRPSYIHSRRISRPKLKMSNTKVWLHCTHLAIQQ